ncbi:MULTISPECIES: hypothetical protein [unclassified Streptomyces]|uniref:hypothetical protein n=1 Tax=unclassified Streptomyces TaxID=2593676 RepID=UPI00037DD5CE|nr:hypothetical protein [Streptomyces sp. 303MFCol5.2]
MSRFAQVIVSDPYPDEVMKPLTRPDDSHSREGQFERLDLFVGAWVIEFERVRDAASTTRGTAGSAVPCASRPYQPEGGTTTRQLPEGSRPCAP